MARGARGNKSSEPAARPTRQSRRLHQEEASPLQQLKTPPKRRNRGKRTPRAADHETKAPRHESEPSQPDAESTQSQDEDAASIPETDELQPEENAAEALQSPTTLVDEVVTSDMAAEEQEEDVREKTRYNSLLISQYKTVVDEQNNVSKKKTELETKDEEMKVLRQKLIDSRQKRRETREKEREKHKLDKENAALEADDQDSASDSVEYPTPRRPLHPVGRQYKAPMTEPSRKRQRPIDEHDQESPSQRRRLFSHETPDLRAGRAQRVRSSHYDYQASSPRGRRGARSLGDRTQVVPPRAPSDSEDDNIQEADQSRIQSLDYHEMMRREYLKFVRNRFEAADRAEKAAMAREDRTALRLQGEEEEKEEEEKEEEEEEEEEDMRWDPEQRFSEDEGPSSDAEVNQSRSPRFTQNKTPPGFSAHETQPAFQQAPTTPTQAAANQGSWGLRSLWGSVSKVKQLIPGLRHAPQSEPPPQARPAITSQADVDKVFEPPNTLFPEGTPTRRRPIDFSKYRPGSTPYRPTFDFNPQTAPRLGATRPRIPASSRPKRTRAAKDADKRAAMIKARQEAADAEWKQEKARKAVETEKMAQQTGQKRKRLRIDELEVIPAGRRPGEFGLMDEFFGHDSDSEEEFEVDDNGRPIMSAESDHEQSPRRPAKRVRFSEPETTPRSTSGTADHEQAEYADEIKDDQHHARPYSGRMFADPSSTSTSTPSSRAGQFTSDPTHSSPYNGSLFANEKPSNSPVATNLFASSQGSPIAKSPFEKSDSLNKNNPNFNHEGTFSVPDDSDDESETSMLSTPTKLSKPPPISTAQINSDDPVTIFGNIYAADKARALKEQEEDARQKVMEAQRKNQETAFETNESTGAGEKASHNSAGSAEAQRISPPNHATVEDDPKDDEHSTTPATSQKEQVWTQPPPPKPTPSHAALPPQNGNGSQALNDNDALARARSQAEKYKPKQPSGLRASSRLSAASAASDIADLEAFGAQDDEPIPPPDSVAGDAFAPVISSDRTADLALAGSQIDEPVMQTLGDGDLAEVIRLVNAVPDDQLKTFSFPEPTAFVCEDPEVEAAVQAAMKDPGFGAYADRLWKSVMSGV